MPFGNFGPLQAQAFSSQPLTFVDQKTHDDLATCLEIDLLENGSKEARELWQRTQLNNLLQFSRKHSAFWRARIPGQSVADSHLESLPILTRQELMIQVSNEGPICPKEYLADIKSYPSSGSTGVPVSVHAMQQNARYNEIRSIAQYLIEGRALNCNRTFIKPADAQFMQKTPGSLVEKNHTWIGSFSSIFQHGEAKTIQYDGKVHRLIEELAKDPVGYLACLGSHMDLLIQEGGVDLLKRLGVKMWLHHSDNFDESHRKILNSAGIQVRSSYSCTEVGPIAVECETCSGHYHVVHSNVLVEADDQKTIDVDGVMVKSLLITHLHSYATPIIRYDVGDYGALHASCACGHDGPTLSHIFGRKKYFLKSLKGSLIPFPLFSKPLLDIVSFKEFFAYQKPSGEIVLELGGVEHISAEQIDRLTALIKMISQNQFQVMIQIVDSIDWSRNPKRLPFISYVD